MKKEKKSKEELELAAAMKKFPKMIKLKEKRAKERKIFLKKTFGKLVKKLIKETEIEP